MPDARGHVALIATGGTISAGPDGPLHASSLIKLAASSPGGIPIDVPVRGEDFTCVPSSRVTADSIESLARTIRDALARAGCLGAVITHGTDTLEEVAFACELLLAERDRPVIFTGAMVPPRHKGTDAHANLAAAIRIASSGAPSGCFVAMHHRLHAPIEVRKQSTRGADAFGSPALGPVGWIGADGVELVREPIRIELSSDALEPRVELVRLVAGGGDRLLRAAAEGSRGLVIELFGAGNAGEDVSAAIAETTRAGITVLVCSRTGHGMPSPETGVLKAGAVPAVVRGPNRPALPLDGLTARVLLTAALGAGLDSVRIAALLGAEAGPTVAWPAV